MRYLLDTNILIWYLTGDDDLNPNLFEIIAYKNNVYISIVSLQEIAIKSRDGGLEMKMPFKKLGDIIRNEGRTAHMKEFQQDVYVQYRMQKAKDAYGKSVYCAEKFIRQ